MKLTPFMMAVLLAAGALSLQGCLAMAVGGAVGGAAVGATGAVVKGTAKGVGAVGRAVIPGDSKDKD
jgi:hypothetical protein